jgi:hypothetical protein
VPTFFASRGSSITPMSRHIGTANKKATTPAVERPTTGIRRHRGSTGRTLSDRMPWTDHQAVRCCRLSAALSDRP